MFEILEFLVGLLSCCCISEKPEEKTKLNVKQ